MSFMFENLAVYQKAVSFAEKAAALTEGFPRGYGFLADQLNRAALSIAMSMLHTHCYSSRGLPICSLLARGERSNLTYPNQPPKNSLTWSTMTYTNVLGQAKRHARSPIDACNPSCAGCIGRGCRFLNGLGTSAQPVLAGSRSLPHNCWSNNATIF